MQNFNLRVSALQQNLARLRSQSTSKKAGSDIVKMLNDTNDKTFFSPLVSRFADTVCVANGTRFNIEPIFEVNPKVSKRFVQMMRAVQEKNYRNVDRTSAVALYALHIAKGMTLATDGLFSLVSGLIVPSANTRGIERNRLARIFGKMNMSASTVSTQLSRSFGANGFGQICGMTYGIPGTSNREFSVNRDHEAFKAFIALIESGTDSQLDSMGESE